MFLHFPWGLGYVYSHQTKRGFIQLMKCWHGISRISQGKIQAVTIWTVSLLVKICSVTNTNIVFRKNGLLLGQIHLPSMDRPSFKCVIKKPLMFFIWIQWKLVKLYLIVIYVCVQILHQVSLNSNVNKKKICWHI